MTLNGGALKVAGGAGACSLKIFEKLGSPKLHVVRFEGSLK